MGGQADLSYLPIRVLSSPIMSMLSRLTAHLVPRSPALSRSMGSGKVFKLRPSQWDWRFYKDILHLYSMLGLIPVGAVIIGANVLVGPADLVDIPEGYEPRVEEYHSHPIKRWFAKYVYDPPERAYEMQCAYHQLEYDTSQHRLLDQKVTKLQRERGDYYGWYYIQPQAPRGSFIAREAYDAQGHNEYQAGLRTV